MIVTSINIGIARNEIIARVDRNEIKLNEAWHDIQMVRQGPAVFSITLPLSEIGHFRAKCFFWAKDSDEPVWPPGEDSVINVEPEDLIVEGMQGIYLKPGEKFKW